MEARSIRDLADSHRLSSLPQTIACESTRRADAARSNLAELITPRSHSACSPIIPAKFRSIPKETNPKPCSKPNLKNLRPLHPIQAIPGLGHRAGKIADAINSQLVVHAIEHHTTMSEWSDLWTLLHPRVRHQLKQFPTQRQPLPQRLPAATCKSKGSDTETLQGAQLHQRL